MKTSKLLTVLTAGLALLTLPTLAQTSAPGSTGDNSAPGSDGHSSAPGVPSRASDPKPAPPPPGMVYIVPQPTPGASGVGAVHTPGAYPGTGSSPNP